MTAEAVSSLVSPVPGVYVRQGGEGEALLTVHGATVTLDGNAVLLLADALFAARAGRLYDMPADDRMPWTEHSRQHIVAAVARRFLVPVESVYTADSADGRRARDVALFLCRELTNASLPQLGLAFRRHHTTVMSAIARVQVRALQDEPTRRMLDGLRREIAG